MVGLALYLLVGYLVYRWRFPDGLFRPEADVEIERIRRIGRRRVLPLPEEARR